MSRLKHFSDKSQIKEYLDYLTSLHNAVSKAKIDHDRHSMDPNIELINKSFWIEGMMLIFKNILKYGVHDTSMLHLLEGGIGNKELFSEK